MRPYSIQDSGQRSGFTFCYRHHCRRLYAGGPTPSKIGPGYSMTANTTAGPAGARATTTRTQQQPQIAQRDQLQQPQDRQFNTQQTGWQADVTTNNLPSAVAQQRTGLSREPRSNSRTASFNSKQRGNGSNSTRTEVSTTRAWLATASTVSARTRPTARPPVQQQPQPHASHSRIAVQPHPSAVGNITQQDATTALHCQQHRPIHSSAVATHAAINNSMTGASNNAVTTSPNAAARCESAASA